MVLVDPLSFGQREGDVAVLSLYHRPLLRHARALSGRLCALRRGWFLYSWHDRGQGSSDLLPYRVLAGGSMCWERGWGGGWSRCGSDFAPVLHAMCLLS
jgi:hypothetical protein